MYYNTVNEHLKNALLSLMKSEVFIPFRLVGGTALSLQLGHCISVDIDLFTDAPYGSIDFKTIDQFIENSFDYHKHFSNSNTGIGKSYAIGVDKTNAIRLDVFYTDNFIQPALVIDDIRMATIEEITAMKIDVIQRGGRKKDFWDLHELFDKYDLSKMLSLHQERYPYTHNKDLILKNLIDFSPAENDFDPICLLGKYWEFIKEDITDIVNAFQRM